MTWKSQRRQSPGTASYNQIGFMRATTLLSIIVFCASCSSVHRYSTLPELPVLDMAKYLPAVREQLQPAYDDVHRNLNDAAANGKLGMLLDAHEQYDSA